MKTGYQISESDYAKINAWLTTLEPEIMEITKKPRYMRYGASGGGVTYEFTPCSLGVSVFAREFYTNKTLDLTDYESW